MKYPFIEYMSYSLKKYGKKTHSFLMALEEVCVQKFSLEKELAQNEEYWSEQGIVDIESLYEAIHNYFNYDIVGVIDTHVPKIFDEFLKNPTEDEMNKWDKDKLFLYDEY